MMSCDHHVPQTLRLLQKVSSVSVLPEEERRDSIRVRTRGGQTGGESDISELDQRVRFVCVGVGMRLVLNVGRRVRC